MSEIRFDASKKELEQLKQFKKKFNIKDNTQAIRTLIALSTSICISPVPINPLEITIKSKRSKKKSNNNKLDDFVKKPIEGVTH